MGEELTATAIAALYLVAYQRGAITLAGVGQILGKLRRGHLDATDALYALQDDGSDTAARQFAYPRLDVVQRQETHVVVVVQRSHNLWIVRHLYGQ